MNYTSFQESYWQLESKLAELHSKRYQVAYEAQQHSMTLFDIERDIERVQRELNEYAAQR